MCDNKLDPRFYPEVYQAVAGKDYTVYAYMNDGSVRKFDVKPLIKKGGVFKKIEDKEIFKNTLTVLNGTFTESLRILAERLSQSKIGLPLRQICCHSPPERGGSLLD